MTKIKRSVHSSLVVTSSNSDYAEGVKDGIIYTLSNLLHECDVIMRVMPYIEYFEGDTDYKVRSRFSVREKAPGTMRGKWIKDFSAYYEENIDGSFIEKPEEEVGISIDGVAVTISTSKSEFKVIPDVIFKKWLSNPLLTDNGQTVGERQRIWIHEKLDQFINQKLEEKDEKAN